MAGLINVGEMGALALHVLVELTALRQESQESRRTVQEIAEKLHASVHTLQKVTRRLIMLGMIEGTRGVNGGLRLTVEPEKITMLDVIQGVEGKVCSNNCMFAKRVCPSGGGCVFNGVTGILEQQIRDYFTKTTLADLCAMSLLPIPHAAQ